MRQVGGLLPTFYHGIVEDRADPMKLGRVKVRVVGVHSDNVLDVPTEDLPWAVIAISPTNAGTSGLGWSPTGLVPGSWVIVYFADGESLQQPVVIGTTVGINPTSKPEPTSQTTTVVKNSPTVNKPTKASLEKSAVETDSEWIPGYITKQREVGSGGAWTWAKDNNGYSYGIIQINQPNIPKFLATSKFADQFRGMSPGTPEFNAKWEAVGKANPTEFGQEQINFSKSINYDYSMRGLKSYNLEGRSPVVQEAIYSTSNQLGGPKSKDCIRGALNGKDVSSLTDADIIKSIYNQKRATVDKLFPNNTAAQKAAYVKGWNEEEELLLANCSDSITQAGLSDPIAPETNVYGEDIINDPVATETVTVPLKLGFMDPTGKYPTPGYLGDPDTNRLARNAKIQKTIVAIKKTQRISSSAYNEPETQYNSKYPYNKVFQSESGHIIEIDDTPGAERLHIYHKSGTFIECYPDGKMVKKVFGEDHEIVLGKKDVYITGNLNINVEGDANINSQGNISIKAENNIEMLAKGNVLIGAGGNIETTGRINTRSAISRFEDIRPHVAVTPATSSLLNKSASEVSVEVGNKIAINLAPPINETITDDDTFNPSETLFASQTEMNKAAGFDVAPEGSPESPIVTDVEPQSAGAKLDLPAEFSPSTRLSEHFTIADLTTGCVVSKYTLRAQAGLTEEEIVKNLQNVAVNVLEPLVSKYGRNSFIITNCFRHTKATDKKTSQHCLGQAVDIQFPGSMGNGHVHKIEEIRRMLPGYDQLILEWHSPNGVIHISYNESNLRRVAFTTYTTNFHGLKGGAFFDRSQTLIYA